MEAFTRRLAFEYAAATDRGRVRPGNEDAVAYDPELGYLMVADGIGGARAGEVASALAVQVIAERFSLNESSPEYPESARAFIESAIKEANLAIWRLGKEEPELAGMGTTLVVGAVGDDWLVHAHVGDSRLYRLRADRLEQLSHDHSLIQEVLDQGLFDSRATARRHGIGDNILTRALGTESHVRVSSGIVDLEAGDVFLLCTDGLSGMVPDDWLRRMLVAGADQTLERVAHTLVRLANARGGVDNITLALLRVVAR